MKSIVVAAVLAIMALMFVVPAPHAGLCSTYYHSGLCSNAD